MTEPLYCLTLKIMFSTEKDLEFAIATFNAWCATKVPKDKKYGFVRTGQLLGKLFFVSTEHFTGWRLFSLARNLESVDTIYIRSFDCPEVTTSHPAS